MKKIIILCFAIVPFILFAVNRDDKIYYVNLFFYEGEIPIEDISIGARITARPTEVITKNSPGTSFPIIWGRTFLRIDINDFPTDWSIGEVLIVVVYGPDFFIDPVEFINGNFEPKLIIPSRTLEGHSGIQQPKGSDVSINQTQIQWEVWGEPYSDCEGFYVYFADSPNAMFPYYGFPDCCTGFVDCNGVGTYSFPISELDYDKTYYCKYESSNQTHWAGNWDFTTETDPFVPVNLSSFYALYINNTPTLYWTTQTEDNNAYWNVYRNLYNNFETAILLTANNPVPGNGTNNYPSDYVFVDNIPIIQNQTYWYWIEDVSLNGATEIHEPITLSIPYDDVPIMPDAYGLYQNYPNPFNPSTSISFNLKEENDVEVVIYNVKGEEIKTIFKDHVFANQNYITVWDGSDKSNKQVSSGIYYYMLKTNKFEKTKRMTLLK